MVFDDVCYHCVDTELADNDNLAHLKEYGIVRPICQTCFDAGKSVATRNASKVKKEKTERNVLEVEIYC